jgi:hypothetical protein
MTTPPWARILVCGGRNYDDRARVYAVLDECAQVGVSWLINGGATGADRLSSDWARDRLVPYREFPADWDDLSHPNALIRKRRDGREYDARAGSRRNQHMLDQHPGQLDLVVAFPGGPGTADMIARSVRAGIRVLKIP